MEVYALIMNPIILYPGFIKQTLFCVHCCIFDNFDCECYNFLQNLKFTYLKFHARAAVARFECILYIQACQKSQ